MGAAKGEPQDEEVPTPTKEATGEAAAAEGEKQRYDIFIVYILLVRILCSGYTLQIKKIYSLISVMRNNAIKLILAE